MKNYQVLAAVFENSDNNPVFTVNLENNSKENYKDFTSILVNALEEEFNLDWEVLQKGLKTDYHGHNVDIYWDDNDYLITLEASSAEVLDDFKERWPKFQGLPL